jgi:hypothetical protein
MTGFPFDAYDTNNDGVMDRKEFEAFARAVAEQQPALPRSPNECKAEQMGVELARLAGVPTPVIRPKPGVLTLTLNRPPDPDPQDGHRGGEQEVSPLPCASTL